MTALLLTTRALGDLSPSTAYRLAASGRLNPVEPAINAILTAIDTNPGATPSLAELALLAGMPYGTFREAFRAATGMSWQRYLIDARMRVARALLASTDKSIPVIAAFVGNQTKEAFAVTFVAEHGMTPTEYRNAHRVGAP